MDTRLGSMVVCSVVLISACIAHRPPFTPQEKKQQVAPAFMPTPQATASPRSFFADSESQKEEKLFYQALWPLFGPAKQDLSTAQAMLENLLNAYPQGKWHAVAAGLLDFIKERDDCRRRLAAGEESIGRAMAENNKSRQENERLQQELRLLNEKYQTEAAGMQQENEQLKKNMELLKKLEIQLNTR